MDTAELTVSDKPVIEEDKKSTFVLGKQKITKKDDISLPLINKIFMIDGIEYRVVYINEGKRRFTCIPSKQVF